MSPTLMGWGVGAGSKYSPSLRYSAWLSPKPPSAARREKWALYSAAEVQWLGISAKGESSSCVSTSEALSLGLSCPSPSGTDLWSPRAAVPELSSPSHPGGFQLTDPCSFGGQERELPDPWLPPLPLSHCPGRKALLVPQPMLGTGSALPYRLTPLRI